jgi:hypothetical protein
MRTDKKHRRVASRNKINGLILIERGVIRGALGCDKECFFGTAENYGKSWRSRRSRDRIDANRTSGNSAAGVRPLVTVRARRCLFRVRTGTYHIRGEE